jgi:hypothetical protein
MRWPLLLVLALAACAGREARQAEAACDAYEQALRPFADRLGRYPSAPPTGGMLRDPNLARAAEVRELIAKREACRNADFAAFGRYPHWSQKFHNEGSDALEALAENRLTWGQFNQVRLQQFRESARLLGEPGAAGI